MARPTIIELVDDLVAEEAALAALLVPLTDDAWDTPTPSPGWVVRDQIAHLAMGEELAALAVTDPDRFTARLRELLADLEGLERAQRQRARELEPGAVLAWWLQAANATAGAMRARDDGDRISWITGPMSGASFVTARLMETWAHGQDVIDALGLAREPSPRLRHIADLGVRTRGFSFRNRGLEVPASEPRVQLAGPAGERWTWGADDAEDRVEGPVEDFCLVVCRRRHWQATRLQATGIAAAAWLEIAQCFAGPPAEPPASHR